MVLDELYAFLELQDKTRLDVSDRINFILGNKEHKYSNLSLENEGYFHEAKLFTNVANIESYHNQLSEVNAPKAIKIDLGANLAVKKINAPDCEILILHNSNRIIKDENINVSENCKIIRGDNFSILEKQIQQSQNENIEGSLIAVFKEDTLKGERTMLDIGIAGENDFSTYKYKKDISSSKNQNFKYEIICTKEELENNIKELETLTQAENFLYKKIKENGDNSDTSIFFNTGEKIRRISSNLGGKYIKEEDTYAYLKKENGEIVDLPKEIRGKEVSFYPSEEEGTLVTNAKRVFLSDNKFEKIEAPKAELIMNKWETKSPLLWIIKAPKCTYLKFYESSLLVDSDSIRINEEAELSIVDRESYYNNAKKFDDIFLIEHEDFFDLDIKRIVLPNATEVNIQKFHFVEDIYADNCEKILCKNLTRLKTLDVPICEEICIENCPELKYENINHGYNCEIEGLEKKNQLKR